MGRSRHKEKPIRDEWPNDSKPKNPYKRLKHKTKDWLTKDWLDVEEDEDDLELLLHMDN